MISRLEEIEKLTTVKLANLIYDQLDALYALSKDEFNSLTEAYSTTWNIVFLTSRKLVTPRKDSRARLINFLFLVERQIQSLQAKATIGK